MTFVILEQNCLTWIATTNCTCEVGEIPKDQTAARPDCPPTPTFAPTPAPPTPPTTLGDTVSMSDFDSNSTFGFVDTASPDGGGSSEAIIIGVLVALAVLIIIVVALVTHRVIKRKRQQAHAPQKDADSSNSNSHNDSGSPSIGEYGRLPPNNPAAAASVAPTAEYGNANALVPIGDGLYDNAAHAFNTDVTAASRTIAAGATHEYESVRAFKPTASEYEDATQPFEF